jgi:putative transposase
VRANRLFIPGYVWHITHRCHKKDFLLKFSQDRENWIRWLFEAKKRFGIRILNYNVTSNHIHLLVIAGKDQDSIPSFMQLLAGRVAQEFNQRKNRKGAFWEDRYHATAVESGKHLINCMIYIDLNMVRAGAVKHPKDWKTSGFFELTSNKARYRKIDESAICEFCGFRDIQAFRKSYLDEINSKLSKNDLQESHSWSDFLAIGSADFVEKFKHESGIKAQYRTTEKQMDRFQLKEPVFSYNEKNHHKTVLLREKNTSFWNKN